MKHRTIVLAVISIAIWYGTASGEETSTPTAEEPESSTLENVKMGFTTAETTSEPCETNCIIRPGCTVDFFQEKCECIYVCMETTEPVVTRKRKCFAQP